MKKEVLGMIAAANTNIFEQYAIILIGGVCASAYLASLIFVRLFKIGECPNVSAVIGAVTGIVMLLISPVKLGAAAIVAAAVVTVIVAVMIDKLYYESGKDLTRTNSTNTAQANVYKPTDNTPAAPKDSWVCTCGKRNSSSEPKCVNCGKPNSVNVWKCKCGHSNPADAKFCQKCGEKHTPMRLKTGKSTATAWVCPKCKKANPNSQRVCKDCGYEK